MIRRYRRSDVLFFHEKIEATGEDAETSLKRYLSRVGKADPLLDWWQAEGERVLQEKGYPVEWESLSAMLQEGEHRPEIHDIAAMLLRLNLARRDISKGLIQSAVWNTAIAVQHGMKAKIRPFEPDVERGQACVDGGGDGGRKSGKVRREKSKPTKDQWQTEANKIWLEHPTWNKSRVARKITKKNGGIYNTVRQSIKNPLS